jgi:predicted phage terminase large subunit-like protein
LTPRTNRYIKTTPTPKQTVFHLLNDVLEVLFGGAAGGGKSEALLRGAAEFVDVPGYSALLLRRTFKELSKSGALMDRAQSWFRQTDAHWSSDTHTWTFPSGATVEFGYLERDADLLQYQSAEYQYIGFDELTQFPAHVYQYMFSRLRRLEGSQVPIRMRGATNPGGPGMAWVKKRFELYGEGLSHLNDPERKFVFSKLEDNPHLDIETYEKSFDQLSDVTRAQLRKGDWSAQIQGGRFDTAWFQLITADEVPDTNMTIRYWDLAASEPSDLDPDPDWTAGVKVARSDKPPERYKDLLGDDLPPTGPFYYILNIARDRKKSGGVEDLIRTVAYQDGYAVPVYIEQERGATGKGTIQRYRDEVLSGFLVRGMWLTGPKPERITALSSRAEEGRVFMVVGPWNEAFLDEAVLYTGDTKGGPHDDQLDAGAGTLFAMEKEGYMRGSQRAGAH